MISGGCQIVLSKMVITALHLANVHGLMRLAIILQKVQLINRSVIASTDSLAVMYRSDRGTDPQLYVYREPYRFQRTVHYL